MKSALFIVVLSFASLARAQDAGMDAGVDAAIDAAAEVDAGVQADADAAVVAEAVDAAVVDADVDAGSLDAEVEASEPEPTDEDLTYVPPATDEPLDETMFVVPPITIRATREDAFRAGGSVQLLDDEELEALDYDDPQATLARVPGVYIRQEDGYGLRPNIGIRGASSERSRKITLMEDGVLFAPAPYSAPAAYYFPLQQRITGVEVWKGPSAILYGPHTVGGAINFLTRDVPDEPGGQLDLALGSYQFGRVHGHYGARTDWGGFLLEGVRLQTTGFKDLDSTPTLGDDADTGFIRDEATLKAFLEDEGDSLSNRIELRLGYGQERSNETYLGISDADFEENPNRRYVATQLDQMRWHRTSAALAWTVDIGDDLQIVTTAYRQDFHRIWRKVNRFRGGPTLETILRDPDAGQRRVFYDVLTGTADSSVSDEAIMLGTNDRTFVSEGVQTEARGRFTTGPFSHDLRVGARLHYDEARRYQTEDAYLMRARQLLAEGSDTLVNEDSTSSALAFAAFALDSITIDRFTLLPGVRVESIWTNYETSAGDNRQSSAIVLPGLGAQVAVTDEIAILAGVHRGFGPVAPGQTTDVRPETSVAYELGGRLRIESSTDAELIGFASDYQNLTGDCSFASGCLDLERQFNGGRVLIAGAEASFGHTFSVGSLLLPVRASYTFTWSRFGSSFDSENPQFGSVEEGDALPYVPLHQGSIIAGLEDADGHSVNVSGTYVSPMREEAGQGDDGLRTDPQVFVDVVGKLQVLDGIGLYLRAENVLLQTPIASRRPFGARPARPFQVQLGATIDL